MVAKILSGYTVKCLVAEISWFDMYFRTFTASLSSAILSVLRVTLLPREMYYMMRSTTLVFSENRIGLRLNFFGKDSLPNTSLATQLNSTN